MSKGKGKEKATEPDWKEKIAMLDQQFGWDDETGSDCADSCDAAKQEVCTPNRPPQSEHDNKDYTEASQSTDNGRENAFQIPSDTLEDGEIMSPEMQQRIWDAAVEESRSSSREHGNRPCEDPSSHAIFDDDKKQVDVAQQQQMEDGEGFETTQEENDKSDGRSNDEGWETAQEEHDEVDDEQEIQPKSALAAYIYHRFGKAEIRYENRCLCHEYLRNHEEEQRKRHREYFAQGGETCLIKDPCVLLPYKQIDLPGTENVDKPVLMVTTPEGETLYPHDLAKYPEPPAASRDDTGNEIVRPLAIRRQSEYLVSYEEEDTPDG